MAMEWSLTKMQYAMNETRNPIDETGRANTHEVGVLGVTIDTENVYLQEMFGEEETEAETTNEMTMRTAAGGGSNKEW